MRDGSLLRLLLSRARVEIAPHARGLHGSTGMESSEMMVIREDEEESSPERAESPGEAHGSNPSPNPKPNPSPKPRQAP